jgi:hypothetical protein
MTTIDLPLIIKKSCGSCTKCCEGWLKADIKGHSMYPGKPCFFVEVGKGCTIYKDRPKDPCIEFSCGWKEIEEMPEEFKPDISGVIMSYKKNKGWVIAQAPNIPTPQYLSWAITYARSRNENILWYVDDKSWWLGDGEFCKQMEIEHSV